MYSVISEFKIGPEGGVLSDLLSPPANAGDDDLGGYTLVDFSLEKDLMTPNVLNFTMRRKNFPKTADMLKFSLASNLLGNKVECTVETRDKESTTLPAHSTLVFKGLILNASMKGMTITCKAVSKDCKYDDAPKSRCFCGKKIQDILNLVMPGVTVRMHTCFNDLKFPYIVQYNESDYEFVTRLAKRFGAFFYYNGTNLVFGKPDKSGLLTLASSDFASLEFNLKTSSPNIKLVGHDYKKNVDLASTPTDFDRNTGGPGHAGGHMFASAVGGSDDLDPTLKFFVDDPNSLQSDPLPAASHFDAYNKALVSSYSSDMVTCTFLTYRLDVQVGSVVKLDQKIKTPGPNGTSVNTPVENGTLFVTSAHVSWDCNGSPKNEVTAFVLPENSTAEDDIFAPYMDFNCYPKSSAQRAEVFNNVDPDKMGRVQVFFSWQKDLTDAEKGELPWIRIAQPYAGKDKGFYVIPEKKEEVMVGFEHDNMEKPFVIGSLYHNSGDDEQKRIPADDWCEVAAAGGNQAKNEENEVKAFRTKKGHTIEFHDTKGGDGFIRIYGKDTSKPNYDIILSTDKIQKDDNGSKSDYTIKSSDDEAKSSEAINEKDYNAEKLRIMVRSNDGDIMLDAGKGDIIMNAANIRINATNNRTTLIGKNDILKVKKDQFTDVGNSSLMVQGEQSVTVSDAVKLKAQSLDMNIDDDTKVKSNSVHSETTKETELKAQSIQVNANEDFQASANSGISLRSKNNVLVAGKVGVSVKSEGDAKIDAGQVTVGSDTSYTTLEGLFMEIKTEGGTRKGIWQDQ